MRHAKVNLLTDKLFLLGLGTLLANDLFLKYAVGGIVTGKLSDVSGLFIFPFFWSVLLEKHRLKIYILTTLLFILWKLPLSSPLLESINEVLGTRFHRVIDYTDLLALTVIPVSYRYLTHQLKHARPASSTPAFVPAIISVVSIVAFVATTLPQYPVKQTMRIDEKIICDLGKEDIFKNRIKPKNLASDQLDRNLADSTFLLHFHIPKYHAEARTWVTIYAIDSTKTMFHIDSLDSYTVRQGKLFVQVDEEDLEEVKNITREELIALFNLHVIQPIHDKRFTELRIYFDNPKLDTARVENY